MEIKNLTATLQKSYYGKAKVITDGDAVSLKSYQTIVCKIVGGQFVRLWGGYSRTTMNHINDFRKANGFDTIGKKEWLALPCKNTDLYQVTFYNGFSSWVAEVTFDDYDAAEEWADSVCGHNSRLWYDIENIA